MTKFAGITLLNCLTAASSPLTESAARLRCCEKAGFGSAILKSCDPTAHDLPVWHRRVLYTPEGYYADGSYPEEIMPLADALKLYDAASGGRMHIIPSVSCLSFDREEWLRGCLPFALRGAELIQLDFFYVSGQIGQGLADLTELGTLLRALRKAMEPYGCRLMPKLNPALEPDGICGTIRDAGIRQVSLLDSVRREPPEGSSLHSGSTSWFSREMLPLTLRYLKSAKAFGLEVCAGGGVDSREDVLTLLENGASLVQTASCVLRRGYRAVPALLGENGGDVPDHRPWCDAEDGAPCIGCGGCGLRPPLP